MSDDDYEYEPPEEEEKPIRMREREEVKRLKTITLDKKIVYGNISFPLFKVGEPAPPGEPTHRWIAYVRSAVNEDLSVWIKKVVFELHSSFENPKRAVEEPPYQVEEKGWGEFELGITLHFQDPAEPPVEMLHSVPSPVDPVSGMKKPICVESFDEVIFNEPTEQMYPKLIAPRYLPAQPLAEHYHNFDEEAEVKKMRIAQKKVRIEIQKLRDKFDKVDAELQVLSAPKQ